MSQLTRNRSTVAKKLTETQRKKIEEQRYQREYYEKNKKKRSLAHKKRWKEDEDYREREIARQRKRRAEARKETASDRFDAMVEEKREALKPTRKPKFVEVGGKRCFVFSTGTLAREVGREDGTIRAWLVSGVLPGASVWIGRRAHFTENYCTAVRNACRRLYSEDGRGDLEILKRLVREEFESAEVFYKPKPRK